MRRVKIGFLGGGQLARMMILEGHRLGLECHVFCAEASEPAAQVTPHFHNSGKEDILQFVDQMDFVTFESEFVATDKLLEIEKTNSSKIFPKPSLMRTLQTRKTQKDLLDQFQIPTSSWQFIKKSSDLSKAAGDFKNKFVLKTNYGGYDGYGTFFCKSAKDLHSLEEQLKSNNSFIAEKFIPFKREVAAILVRSSKDEIISMPLVETQQKNGRCDVVLGPISHLAWPNLQKKFVKLMRAENYVGALAVEMFDTGKELLVNELAPRVHNSGHYSQNFLTESQFTLHLKAGLGMGLNPTKNLAPAFVSLNLLGLEKEFQIPKNTTGSLHWYGKLENRLGRKMGHLNFLGKNTKTLLPLALKERKRFAT